MDDTKAVVVCLGMLMLVILALCTTCGITTDRQIQAIVQMVNGGADPIAAKCSLQGQDTRDPVCVAYAARTKQQGGEQ